MNIFIYRNLKKKDIYVYLHVFLNTTYTVFIYKYLSINLQSFEYTNFVKWYSVFSLVSMPSTLLLNLVNSHLFSEKNDNLHLNFNYILYLISLSSIYIITILFITLTFDDYKFIFFAVSISYLSLIYINSVPIIDYYNFHIQKLVIFLISLAISLIFIYFNSYIYHFFFFLFIRQFLIFILIRIRIKEYKKQIPSINLLLRNLMLVITQTFSSDGLKLAMSFVLNNKNFVIFDLLYRIIYSIRSFLGQLQLQSLIDISKNESNTRFKNNFILLNFLTIPLVLLSYWLFQDNFKEIDLTLYFTSNYIGISINLYASRYYIVLSRNFNYLIMSMITIYIPIFILFISFYFNQFYYSLPIAFMTQAFLIKFIMSFYYDTRN